MNQLYFNKDYFKKEYIFFSGVTKMFTKSYQKITLISKE